MNKVLRIFGFVLLVGGGGYLLGKFHQNPSVDGGHVKNKSQVQEKLQLITDTELQEYLELKEQKQKFAKANEILEKIMKIFLMDLGLRISNANMNALKGWNQASSPGLTAQDQRKNSIDNPPVKKAIVRSLPVKEDGKSKQSNYKEIEKKLPEVRSEEEAKKLLDSMASLDIFSEVRNSVPISEVQFKNLQGSFAGEVTFFESQKVPYDVEMKVSGKVEDGKITGETLILMYKNGKLISRTSGNGNLRNFSGTKESGAILVDAFGGSGFFQLYYFDRLGLMMGNYYEEEGNSKTFSRVGQLRFSRL